MVMAPGGRLVAGQVLVGDGVEFDGPRRWQVWYDPVADRGAAPVGRTAVPVRGGLTCRPRSRSRPL